MTHPEAAKVWPTGKPICYKIAILFVNANDAPGEGALSFGYRDVVGYFGYAEVAILVMIFAQFFLERIRRKRCPTRALLLLPRS